MWAHITVSLCGVSKNLQRRIYRESESRGISGKTESPTMNVSERMTLFSDGANGFWQQGGVDKVTMTTDESWRKGEKKKLLCLHHNSRFCNGKFYSDVTAVIVN